MTNTRIKRKSLLICILALSLYAVVVLPTGQSAIKLGEAYRQPKQFWFKGNTHTHTLNSDGDSTPDDVVKWYREHDYHFLVITDHEFITNVETLNASHGRAGQFAVFSGQEVTDRCDGKPYHVNALGIRQVVMPRKGTSAVDTLQRDVNAVRAAHGVPQINHPNFGWAVTADDLKQIQNVKLFEVFNGHPLVNNLGGGGVPGVEAIWDSVLSSGKIIYGVAVDDSHHFKRIGDKSAATPGHGWVVVRASELSPDAIFSAMERGDFYASTGVELADYQVTKSEMTVTVKEERSRKYRIQFIGHGGRLLSEAIANPAVYKFNGDEGYVRAKVFESNGKLAWTQPVMVTKF